MSKRNIIPSVQSYPELAALVAENDRLRREVAELKAQVAAIHVGVKAILDAIIVPEVDKLN